MSDLAGILSAFTQPRTGPVSPERALFRSVAEFGGRATGLPLGTLFDVGAQVYDSYTGTSFTSAPLPGATGSSGAAGASGATGSSRAAGASGATGSSGAAGASGATGSSGAAGASGATGSSGAAGASGATGSSGAAGASGATGSSGAAGASGATGASGAAGATGATGASGAARTNRPTFQGVPGAPPNAEDWTGQPVNDSNVVDFANKANTTGVGFRGQNMGSIVQQAADAVRAGIRANEALLSGSGSGGSAGGIGRGRAVRFPMTFWGSGPQGAQIKAELERQVGPLVQLCNALADRIEGTGTSGPGGTTGGTGVTGASGATGGTGAASSRPFAGLQLRDLLTQLNNAMIRPGGAADPRAPELDNLLRETLDRFRIRTSGQRPSANVRNPINNNQIRRLSDIDLITRLDTLNQRASAGPLDEAAQQQRQELQNELIRRMRSSAGLRDASPTPPPPPVLV